MKSKIIALGIALVLLASGIGTVSALSNSDGGDGMPDFVPYPGNPILSSHTVPPKEHI